MFGIPLKYFKAVDKGFSILELLFVVAIVGILSAIATIALSNHLYKTRVARCITEIQMIVKEITVYKSEKETFPVDLTVIHRESLLDPWGNPYQYLNIANGNLKGKGNLRKDHNLVPINTDYDLYSKGADGDSKPPLTAKSSHDDIIRANDGAYVGLASNY